MGLGRLYRRFRSGRIRLRDFILVAVLISSCVSFGIGHLSTALFFTSAEADDTVGFSRILAGQLQQRLIAQMRLGGDHAPSPQGLIIDEQEGAELRLTATLFGADQIRHLEPDTDQRPWPPQTQAQLAAGQTLSSRERGIITHLLPLRAETTCRPCHDVADDTLLGVIRVEQDLAALLGWRGLDLLAVFAVMAPLPVLVALLLASGVNRRICSATSLLRGKIRQTTRWAELSNIEQLKVNVGFTDLNRIYLQVRDFSRKMQRLAVDKRLLEFQIGLLETAAITPDRVKDWKPLATELLREINTLVRSPSLFAVFQTGESTCAVDIFWLNPPTETDKTALAEAISARFDFRQSGRRLLLQEIHHTIAASDEVISDTDRIGSGQLSWQLPMRYLGSSRVGGLLGLGLQTETVKDGTVQLILDSTLATLANVLDSVKALYGYTRELQTLATRDPLTQLYNRRMFSEFLADEVFRSRRTDKPLAVLFIDFDDFKSVNDHFGHAFGDHYLVTMAARIEDSLREADILARLGGDEFAALLPDTDEILARTVAQRIGQEVANLQLMAPGGTPVRGTVSQGLACFPHHAQGEAELLLVADSMMFKAKRAGRNAIGSPTAADLKDIYGGKEEKTTLIINALENTDLLIPYFQPIKSTQGGKLEIHELLMRLRDGDRIVTAQEFVEQAEDAGLMHQLDLCLISKAFRKIHEEQYTGLLFVNISPKSLVSDDFVDRIRQLTRQYAIDPTHIVFEITERHRVRNLYLLESFVNDLKAEGFRFAVDDFGSGYSSFQYIKSFAIDYLKINGEFILNMAHDATYRAFVKSIVTLARELGIQTVAEFVEDAEMLTLSETFGIDYAQGYHIGHPAGGFAVVGPGSAGLTGAWT